MGLPAAAKSLSGAQKAQESMSLMSVVLSPPGKDQAVNRRQLRRLFDHAGFDRQGVEHFAVGCVVALQSQNSNHRLYHRIAPSLTQQRRGIFRLHLCGVLPAAGL